MSATEIGGAATSSVNAPDATDDNELMDTDDLRDTDDAADPGGCRPENGSAVGTRTTPADGAE